MKKAGLKLVSLAVALVVAAAAGSSVLAYNQSPGADTQVKLESATVTVNGKQEDLSAYVISLDNSKVEGNTQLTPAQIETYNQAQTAIKAADLTLVSMNEVSLTGDAAKIAELTKVIKENGLKLTYKIPGLQSGATYEYRHCASNCDPKDISTWEKGPVSVDTDNQTGTIVLHSLSPVAIIMTGKTTTTTAKVPGTGAFSGNAQSSVLWVVAGMAILTAVAGVSIFAVKRGKKSN